MKPVALGMMRYKLWVLLFLLASVTVFCQNGPEREHRINNAQFPSISMDTLFKVVKDAELKKVRYYKAVDSTETIYILKFKMQRLDYQMHFNSNGKLQKVGFGVKEVDIPSDTFTAMQRYLQERYDKIKVRRMFQEYNLNSTETSQTTIKNAFQNLLLPTNRYRLLIIGKNASDRQPYEVIFNAEGEMETLSHTLPPNYDRILY